MLFQLKLNLSRRIEKLKQTKAQSKDNTSQIKVIVMKEFNIIEVRLEVYKEKEKVTQKLVHQPFRQTNIA